MQLNFDRFRPALWLLMLLSLPVTPSVLLAQPPTAAMSPPQMAHVALDVVGFDDQFLPDFVSLIEQAIASGDLPGCVICFGRTERIAYLHSFGNRQLLPSVEPMTNDTIFDLASLTKPIATASSIMILVEQNKIDLQASVADYLPEFGEHGKKDIRVLDLLVHQSGLIPDNPLNDYDSGAEQAWKNICSLKLTSPIGTTFQYSDVNFIVLGKLIEQVAGTSLDRFCHSEIFEPLGMNDTSFCPDPSRHARCAPTEQVGGHWLRGVVHDPRARRLQGVAGHAGLFSTATDLAAYASFMIANVRDLLHATRSELEINPDESLLPAPTANANERLAERGKAIFDCPALATMTYEYPVSSGVRGLGWDKRTGYSINRGKKLSSAAFGHGGFTGTVVWIDPELDFFFIFLSNRLHPDGQGNVNSLSGKLIDQIISAQHIHRIAP